MLGKVILLGGGLCCASALSVGGLVGYSAWNGIDPLEFAHELSHEVRLCAGDHAPADAEFQSVEKEAAAAGPTCQRPGVAGAVAVEDDRSGRRKVIDYITDRVIAERGIPEITSQELVSATGVDLSTVGDLTREMVQMEVYHEMVRRGIDVEALFGATTCSRLSACSVHRNLIDATGEELALYEQESELDGTSYENWKAPDFNLPATDGSTISISEYRGRPVLLTFLAGHCNHSLDTLPMLDRIQRRYTSTGLAVLPVYVNSGSVEDVQSWTSPMDLELPLAISETRAPADAYGSYLVPATFLIDRSGLVARRLVGFREEQALTAEVDTFLAGEHLVQ